MNETITIMSSMVFRCSRRFLAFRIRSTGNPLPLQYPPSSSLPRFYSSNAIPSTSNTQSPQHSAQTTTPTITPKLTITERAAQRINAINHQDKTSNVLRVQVDSGGCHGFQYVLKLDDKIDNDDVILEKDGAKVAIDPTSLDLIQGSKLDYVQELIGSSFQIVENPNADTGCGCGHSFNIKI